MTRSMGGRLETGHRFVLGKGVTGWFGRDEGGDTYGRGKGDGRLRDEELGVQGGG